MAKQKCVSFALKSTKRMGFWSFGIMKFNDSQQTSVIKLWKIIWMHQQNFIWWTVCEIPKKDASCFGFVLAKNNETFENSTWIVCKRNALIIHCSPFWQPCLAKWMRPKMCWTIASIRIQNEIPFKWNCFSCFSSAKSNQVFHVFHWTCSEIYAVQIRERLSATFHNPANICWVSVFFLGASFDIFNLDFHLEMEWSAREKRRPKQGQMWQERKRNALSTEKEISIN